MKLKNIVIILSILLLSGIAIAAESGMKEDNNIMMSPYPDNGGGPDPMPNLKLNVSCTPTLYNEDTIISFTIKAENDGLAHSVACKMIFIRGLEILHTFDVPGLNPGTSATFTYNWAVECGVQIMIWLDDSLNAENNENDNSWSKTFSCNTVVHQVSPGAWKGYRLADLKNIELPVPCTNYPPWHKNLKPGDPVDILNGIADKIAEGKGLIDIQGDWKNFLTNSHGLDPNSAIRIIFDGSVRLAKRKLQTETAILDFQNNLSEIIIGLHSLAEVTFSF